MKKFSLPISSTAGALPQFTKWLDQKSLPLAPRLTDFLGTAEALSLRFTDTQESSFEIRVHFKNSGQRYYRSGSLLVCSYSRADANEQRHPAIDEICDRLLSTEAELLPLFETEPQRAEILAAPSGLLSGATAALGLDAFAVTVADPSAIGLEARRGTTRVRLTVRRRGTMRNPYVAGKEIDVCLDEVVVDPSSLGLLEELTRLVLENESDLYSALSSLAGAPNGNGARRELLPVVGNLSKLVRCEGLPGAVSANDKRHALVYLSSPCFANCIFCGEQSTREFTFADVDRVIDSIRADSRDVDKVWIVGFEPLSHPGVPEIIAACRSVGIGEVELTTSGIPLGNSRLVDELLDAGLTSVAVPLYSHIEATNDFIMRKAGAFEKTVRGLDAISKSACKVHVHSLILKQNVADIDALFDFVVGRWNASFVAAPARSKNNFEETAPSYREINRLIERAPVVSVPFCLYPRMRESQDLDLTRPLQQTIASAADSMRPYLGQNLQHTSACSQCKYRRACLGIIPEQLVVEPDLKLVPFVDG